MTEKTWTNDIKLIALDRAILSGCGNSYDSDTNKIVDHNKILEATKAFEAYLKGE